METDLRSATTIVDAQPAVSWAAVAAGAVATAALTLLLVAFGAGMGFSAVSPWSDSGVSASTFNIATGIYLVLIGVISSAVGGYIAGRLRSKWTGVHTNEVFFRDTAHGFLAWAFATLISAASRLLRPGGAVTLIWRADGLDAVLASVSASFGAIGLLPIHPKPDTPAIRVVVRAVKGSRAPLSLLAGFVLADQAGKPTAQAEAVLRGTAVLPLSEK
jgi:hypothetical protein